MAFVSPDTLNKTYHLDDMQFNNVIRSLKRGEVRLAAYLAEGLVPMLEKVGGVNPKAAARRTPNGDMHNCNVRSITDWAEKFSKAVKYEASIESYNKALKQLQCIQATAAKRVG